MSFVDQSRRPSPASMAAVVGIHAAIGFALVAGLTISGGLPEIINKMDVRDIPEAPPPPPPPPVDEVVPQESVTPPVFVPQPKFELKPINPPVETTELIPPPVPLPQPGTGPVIEQPRPSPKPSFDAVAAKPRNDPTRWLTNADYKPSWARRELTGLAKFRLEIAANGKVTNCSVTGSTGHSELDEATCSLVTRRARFEPARGGSGEPVAGSYTGSVIWELPE
ncbi:energy transducer TonB [Qipengyuania sp. RANM35]|uniref:energy transducer TonB n=1 Tax=Qipengyuania sp. RANM35 TaxID=3068635 RepID=UPI0034DB0D41